MISKKDPFYAAKMQTWRDLALLRKVMLSKIEKRKGINKMRNMVILYKRKDGSIYCQELSEEGRKYIKKDPLPNTDYYWDGGGTILLEELEEILDKEV